MQEGHIYKNYILEKEFEIMAKKTDPKKKENPKVEKGEQIPLIDVLPEKAKPILRIVKQYKAVQKTRIEALAKEKELKQKVLDEVKKAGFKALDDGTIKFVVEGFTISVEPRDEVIKIKEEE